MKSYGYIAFVLFASLLPHQILTKNVPNSSDLINKVCASTMYKDLCLSMFNSISGSDKADLQGLTKMSIQYSLNYCTSALQKIKGFPSQPCLGDCSDVFDDASDQLKDSLKAIDQNRLDDVKTWVSATLTDADTCKDGCGEGSPVAPLSDTFGHLCSIILALANQLG